MFVYAYNRMRCGSWGVCFLLGVPLFNSFRFCRANYLADKSQFQIQEILIGPGWIRKIGLDSPEDNLEICLHGWELSWEMSSQVRLLDTLRARRQSSTPPRYCCRPVLAVRTHKLKKNIFWAKQDLFDFLCFPDRTLFFATCQVLARFDTSDLTLDIYGVSETEGFDAIAD